MTALKRSTGYADGYVQSLSHPANITKLLYAKGLLLDVLSLNLEIGQMLEGIMENSEVVWEAVHKPTSKIVSFIQSVAHFLRSVFSNAQKFFKQLWKSFKGAMKKKDRACVEKSNEEEQRMAGNDHKFSNDAKRIQKNVITADKVLGELSNMSEYADSELKVASNQTRQSFEKLQRAAAEGGSNTSMQALLQEAEDIENKADAAACKKRMSSVASKLKSALAAVRNATTKTLPNLGIRGVSVTSFAFSAGLEEYIDFRNREIAWVNFNARSLGASMATVIGAGGYAGIGWKGYKEDWTLQECISTGLFYSTSLNIPLPLSFGFGVVVATDADDSSRIWVPDPKGVNGVTFGWSLSHGLKFVVSEDAGKARYNMLTSECYDDKDWWWARKSWKCKGCMGKEGRQIKALRTALHLASFPIVTEIMHDYLAWRNNKHNKKTKYKPKCSDLSVNNRDDPTKIVTSIAKELLQAADRLREVGTFLPRLQESLTAARSNKELFVSNEWKQLHKKWNHQFCRERPPRMRISASNKYHSASSSIDLNVRTQQKGTKKINFNYEEFMKMSVSAVRHLCVTMQREFQSSAKANMAKRYVLLESANPDIREKIEQDMKGLRCKSRAGSWPSKRKLVKKILEMQDPYVGPSHPFGKCYHHSDCKYLPNTSCHCVHPFKTQWKCTYRCTCAAGFCHQFDRESRDDRCIADVPEDRIERLLNGLKSWSVRRGLQVGALVNTLEGISGAPIAGETAHDEYKQVSKVLKKQIRDQARPSRPTNGQFGHWV
eukprot:gnl/MRDRNA2_/MRDRNA2_137049_c0_seq1.p1 gnl/MRDRNA2_/MRDRNA2_137049_c0~~gnl/MRDRNA2_/MRDRNA2_137049_c0_seq1.p1  ORF type:complete len:866 (+),score=136.69 gnl/MRDRNA2_/MRDRNA2_137049_c0_seq1:279-2600(+)